MENQQIPSFHAQSYGPTPPLPLSHAQMRPFQYDSYTYFITTLQYNFEALSFELQNMRIQVKQMQEEVVQLQQRQKQVGKGRAFILIREKSGRMRKEFTKHLSCPFQQCRSRYSSRIALRAHLRRAHSAVTPTESESD